MFILQSLKYLFGGHKINRYKTLFKIKFDYFEKLQQIFLMVSHKIRGMHFGIKNYLVLNRFKQIFSAALKCNYFGNID